MPTDDARANAVSVVARRVETWRGGFGFEHHPQGHDVAGRQSGKYSNRTINGGIGHNLPQEAPQAFAEAVVDVTAES
jgi:hypothetical protein